MVRRFLVIAFCVWAGLFSLTSSVRASQPVVQAVLFYSPICGHCQKVLTQDLPPLQEKYGSQFQVVHVNVTADKGQKIYQDALNMFKIPDERQGVPTMILGQVVMVGSAEIPDQLPGLIEAGLASGGVDFPEIPGLLAAADPTPVPITPVTPAVNSQPRFIQRFMLDPLANSIAVIVLVGMLGSLAALGYRFINPPEENQETRKKMATPAWRRWIVPVLCVLGLVVAGYLTYVEISHNQAICGPIGNCNAVQTSKYATLWGFLPVGVFGMIGYVAILIAWLVQLFTTDSFKLYSALVVWGLALLGVIFSIYLTFLEAFVIGATCAWCISSAIIITLLLWSTTGPAIQASTALSGDSEDGSIQKL